MGDIRKKARMVHHNQDSLPHLARLKAVGSKHAGAFLNGRLNFHQGPKMSGTEFVEAILFRLGYSRFEQDAICTSGHTDTMRHDSLASNAVSCTTSGDPISRHNEVADYTQRSEVRRLVKTGVSKCRIHGE